MKIYLYFNNDGWKLVNSNKEKNFADLLEERNIKISDYAKIGYFAKISDYAKIGDYAEIGYFAEIGDKFCTTEKDIFSELNIFYMTGILIQNGKGIFYKAVKPDLSCFYENENRIKYQYIVGKGDENKKLKKDQSIDCGEGWHWTSYEKAVAFARRKPHKIISAEIDVKDILSVYTKIRVKKFSNVQVVKL